VAGEIRSFSGTEGEIHFMFDVCASDNHIHGSLSISFHSSWIERGVYKEVSCPFCVSALDKLRRVIEAGHHWLWRGPGGDMLESDESHPQRQEQV